MHSRLLEAALDNNLGRIIRSYYDAKSLVSSHVDVCLSFPFRK
jgi:hypothetical protein